VLEFRIEKFAIANAPRRTLGERFGQPVDFVEQPTVAQVGVEVDDRHEF